MEIGDRVQTLNTFVPITGEIVDMYKNLVTIADDDAETVDQLLSFHADDLEVISWTTKKFLSATKVKPKSMQTPPLNLAYKTTFITNFFIVMNEIVERSSGYWIVDDCGVVDGPFISYSEALENLED